MAKPLPRSEPKPKPAKPQPKPAKPYKAEVKEPEVDDSPVTYAPDVSSGGSHACGRDHGHHSGHDSGSSSSDSSSCGGE